VLQTFILFLVKPAVCICSQNCAQMCDSADTINVQNFGRCLDMTI